MPDVIYDVENGSFERTYHISTPAHLIDYVDDNIMAAAGLKVAKETLSTYEQIATEQQADYFYGFITEPCRIENVNEINEIILYAQEKAIRLEKAITEVPKIIHINDRVKQRNKEEIRVYEDLVVYLIQLKREKGEEL